MVNITRVYTRTGDKGTTALGDFSRVSKTDPRLEAYADANEANAAIGVAIAAGALDEDVVAVLTRVQNDLFDVGADLCNPLATEYAYEPLRVKQEWIDELERDCDEFLTRLEKLRSFILPGGSPGSAYLHLATTIVRRAERRTWVAIETYGTEPAQRAAKAGSQVGTADDAPDVSGEREAGGAPGGVNVLAATYLNRLSDLLFVLARIANVDCGGDVLWQPGGGREEHSDKRAER